jgi:hypothetical protein
VLYRGQVLREAPDLDDPELRRINVMLTTRCEARDRLQQVYVEKHPDDYRVGFLNARLTWIRGDLATAESMMEMALKHHPDFSSAKVLLASIQIARGQYPQAQVLLDQLEIESPHDMWAFIDRLKVENALAPSTDTYVKAEEILNNPGFPLTVRDTAGELVQSDPAMTPLRLYAIFQTWTSFEDQIPNWSKAAFIAQRLIEHDEQYALARKILEISLARVGNSPVQVKLRTFLAESYLLEAAKSGPVPSAENAELTKKAAAALNGDLTPLSQYIGHRHDLAKLQPFLAAKTDFNAVDEYGRTVICNAVVSHNPVAVKTALDAGADPNGTCEKRPLIDSALHGASDPPQKMQSILQALLEAGARPDMTRAIQSCANKDNGAFCGTYLLPILNEFRDGR